MADGGKFKKMRHQKSEIQIAPKYYDSPNQIRFEMSTEPLTITARLDHPSNDLSVCLHGRLPTIYLGSFVPTPFPSPLCSCLPSEIGPAGLL